MDITYEEWFDKYKPKTNKHGEAHMYETYSPYIDPVLDTPETYIWTIVDGGDYFGYSAGFHRVNRLGYYICEVPWESEDLYVDLFEANECDITGEHMWVDYVRAIDNKTIKVCEFCEMSKDEYDEYND